MFIESDIPFATRKDTVPLPYVELVRFEQGGGATGVSVFLQPAITANRIPAAIGIN